MPHLSEANLSSSNDNNANTEQAQASSSGIMCPGAFPSIDDEHESFEVIQDNESETHSVITLIDSDNDVDIASANNYDIIVPAPPLVDFDRLKSYSFGTYIILFMIQM
jgi:hypothetical protein